MVTDILMGKMGCTPILSTKGCVKKIKEGTDKNGNVNDMCKRSPNEMVCGTALVARSRCQAGKAPDMQANTWTLNPEVAPKEVKSRSATGNYRYTSVSGP